MQARDSTVEIDILAKIAQGSEEALSCLYDRYARFLYSLIVAILKDPRDAEEVLQEVFLQIWKGADRYDRRRGSVGSYLATLARSRAIDHTRGRNFARRRELEASFDRSTLERKAAPDDQLDAYLLNERAVKVREMLEKIPAEQRQVMHLAYFLGHSQSEIARHLDIPLGTVKTRMRQGLITLHRLAAEESV